MIHKAAHILNIGDRIIVDDDVKQISSLGYGAGPIPETADETEYIFAKSRDVGIWFWDGTEIRVKRDYLFKVVD